MAAARSTDHVWRPVYGLGGNTVFINNQPVVSRSLEAIICHKDLMAPAVQFNTAVEFARRRAHLRGTPVRYVGRTCRQGPYIYTVNHKESILRTSARSSVRAPAFIDHILSDVKGQVLSALCKTHLLNTQLTNIR